jgi:hypothetical protein
VPLTNKNQANGFTLSHYLRVANLPTHVTQVNILEIYAMGKVNEQYVKSGMRGQILRLHFI